jgi:TonB family protein
MLSFSWYGETDLMNRRIEGAVALLAVALAAACGSRPGVSASPGPKDSCTGLVAATAELAGAVGLTGVRQFLSERGWIPGSPEIEVLAAETKPLLTNARQVQLSILKRYPPALRNAGIGGTTVLRVLIGSSGRVRDAVVVQGSGHEQIDGAARESVREMRFEPLLREGCALLVLADVPVQLSVH